MKRGKVSYVSVNNSRLMTLFSLLSTSWQEPASPEGKPVLEPSLEGGSAPLPAVKRRASGGECPLFQ